MVQEDNEVRDAPIFDDMEEATAVNEEFAIPAADQRRAAELVRTFVERERELMERKRASQPDTELLERRAAFEEEFAERLVAELNLTEEYEDLLDLQQSVAEAQTGVEPVAVEFTDGGDG